MHRKFLLLPSRTDVIEAAAQSFPNEDGYFIMDILDLYGEVPEEPHREFMQIAIVHYAKGDLEKLLRCVEAAKHDYEDFLWFEAFAAPIPEPLANWDFTPHPILPPSGQHTKEVVAKLLGVEWPQIDEWVASGLLKPTRNQHGKYRISGDELERFQRARDDEKNIKIDEIWKRYSQ